MAELDRFMKNSYITKRQFTIYQLLMNRDLTIKDVAKKLGVSIDVAQEGKELSL